MTRPFIAFAAATALVLAAPLAGAAEPRDPGTAVTPKSGKPSPQRSVRGPQPQTGGAEKIDGSKVIFF